MCAQYLHHIHPPSPFPHLHPPPTNTNLPPCRTHSSLLKELTQIYSVCKRHSLAVKTQVCCKWKNRSKMFYANRIKRELGCLLIMDMIDI
jgi:hypothetical protein